MPKRSRVGKARVSTTAGKAKKRKRQRQRQSVTIEVDDVRSVLKDHGSRSSPTTFGEPNVLSNVEASEDAAVGLASRPGLEDVAKSSGSKDTDERLNGSGSDSNWSESPKVSASTGSSQYNNEYTVEPPSPQSTSDEVVQILSLRDFTRFEKYHGKRLRTRACGEDLYRVIRTAKSVLKGKVLLSLPSEKKMKRMIKEKRVLWRFACLLFVTISGNNADLVLNTAKPRDQKTNEAASVLRCLPHDRISCEPLVRHRIIIHLSLQLLGNDELNGCMDTLKLKRTTVPNTKNGRLAKLIHESRSLGREMLRRLPYKFKLILLVTWCFSPPLHRLF